MMNKLLLQVATSTNDGDLIFTEQIGEYARRKDEKKSLPNGLLFNTQTKFFPSRLTLYASLLLFDREHASLIFENNLDNFSKNVFSKYSYISLSPMNVTAQADFTCVDQTDLS